LENYIKPNIITKFSGVKVQLWEWIEREIGNQDSPFEVDQGELADRFDVSRTAIINAFKVFVSANLMEKVSSGRGRGNHCKYKLMWTFREPNSEKCNPPSRAGNKYSPQEKNLTKGGKPFRYFAYKFRKLFEKSNLAQKAQITVGKLLNYLEGKPKDLAKTWLIYLRNWINEGKRTLKDFFVYFHDTLKDLAREKEKVERTNERIEEQRKKKKEVRKQFQEDPPPRSKDFARFSDYVEAMELYRSEKNEQKEWEKAQ